MNENENTQRTCYIRRNITLGTPGYGDKWCIAAPSGARISPFGTKAETLARFARLPLR